jgi:predicted  nucleic acid-binding Zn-ribbon protein
MLDALTPYFMLFAVLISLGGLLYNYRTVKLRAAEYADNTFARTMQAHVGQLRDRVEEMGQQLARDSAECARQQARLERKLEDMERDMQQCHSERDQLRRQVLELLAQQHRGGL